MDSQSGTQKKMVSVRQIVTAALGIVSFVVPGIAWHLRLVTALYLLSLDKSIGSLTELIYGKRIKNNPSDIKPLSNEVDYEIAKSFKLEPNPACQEQKTKKHNRTYRTLVFIRNIIWIHLPLIFVATCILTFQMFRQNYQTEYWLPSILDLIPILPFPFTILAILGLLTRYENPKRIGKKVRTFNNLYLVVATKGSNREAIYRSWHALKQFDNPTQGIHVIVLTDEPYEFSDISCITVPSTFQTVRARYKARALEYFRILMNLTVKDWVLHLDEESTVDQAALDACIQFIEQTKYDYGQGLIIYNQHEYWQRPLMTAADSVRVGEDITQYHFQYRALHRAMFGVHGSFLLTNGALENEVTWEISGMTEDFEFALKCCRLGYRCGEISGIVREQSPKSLGDYLKQRRRWIVGTKMANHPMAKYLLLQWISSVVCSILGCLNTLSAMWKIQKPPLWLGFLENLSYVVFCYKHLLGSIIQDYDAGYSVPAMMLNVVCTLFLFPFCAILQSVAVLYGLVTTPKEFEVIQK